MSRYGLVEWRTARELRCGDLLVALRSVHRPNGAVRFGGVVLNRVVTSDVFEEDGQVSFVFADGALTVAADRPVMMRRVQ